MAAAAVQLQKFMEMLNPGNKAHLNTFYLWPRRQCNCRNVKSRSQGASLYFLSLTAAACAIAEMLNPGTRRIFILFIYGGGGQYNCGSVKSR